MTNLSNVSYDDYLDFEDTLMHFGVKGMKWGVRNDDEPLSRRQAYKQTVNQATQNYKAQKSALDSSLSANRKKYQAEGMSKRDAKRQALSEYGKATAENKQKYSTTKNRARERRDNYGYKTMKDARKTEYSDLKGLAANTVSGMAAMKAASATGNPKAASAVAFAAYGNVLRSSYKTYQKQGLSKGEAMTFAIATGPIGNIAIAEINARRGNNAVKTFERYQQSKNS